MLQRWGQNVSWRIAAIPETAGERINREVKDTVSRVLQPIVPAVRV
jgi:hypothetical protein